jgi:hypothetical protein
MVGCNVRPSLLMAILFNVGVNPAFGRRYLVYVAYCVGFREIYYFHFRGQSDQCESEIIIIKIIFCGPGSSGGIATNYGLEGPAIETRWKRGFPYLS